MTINYKNYPAAWLTEIRPNILKRANNCCEQCGVANHALITRSVLDGALYIVYDPDVAGWTQPDGSPIRLSEIPDEFADAIYDGKETKVILTIHHIGVNKPDGTKGDPHDKMDCRDENLIALCQRCHLLADMPTHIAKRARTLAKKKHQAEMNRGQLPLDLGGAT